MSDSDRPEVGPRFTIAFSKQDFKFSSAHFAVFGPRAAERLHGHNYRVAVELEGSSLDKLGLLVEAQSFELAVRGVCETFDNHTLLPTSCPHVQVEERGDQVLARLDDREYVFPRQDVVFLDEVNVSIEMLARFFWRQLVASPLELVDTLTVEIAETEGQSCRYRRRVA